jgi:hypothetical protein
MRIEQEKREEDKYFIWTVLASLQRATSHQHCAEVQVHRWFFFFREEKAKKKDPCFNLFREEAKTQAA